MDLQPLTLPHFKDVSIDNDFRGRIRFILPNFLPLKNENINRIVLLHENNMLRDNPNALTDNKLPPLRDQAVKEMMANTIRSAITEINDAKTKWSINIQKDISTNICLRPVILNVDHTINGILVSKDTPTLFYEVWNGYNQIDTIKYFANNFPEPFESMFFYANIITDLPINNDDAVLSKIKDAFDLYNESHILN